MGNPDDSVSVKIGPEVTFMPGGLQPFMVRAGTGRLFVTAQLPVPLGTHFPGVWAGAYSDDGGVTWQEWSRPNVPGGSPFFEGCAAQLADGRVMLLQWSAKGPQKDGGWVAKLWESFDGWETVTGPVDARFDIPDAKGGFDDDGHPAGEMFLHRTLLELPSGELLVTGYGWFKEDNTPSTYRATMNKLRSILLRSKDKGRTWVYGATIAVGPEIGEEGFNEPAMVRVPSGKHAGRLVAHLRTGSNKTYRHNPIYQSVSDDDGRTWSKPAPLGFVGNVDPDVFAMADGTLVATYGFRTFESRVNMTGDVPKTIGKGHGNYIAFSFDGGDTWVGETQVTSEPTTCYPAAAEVSPGKLAYVYDVGDAWQHVWIGYEGIKRSLACRVLEIKRKR